MSEVDIYSSGDGEGETGRAWGLLAGSLGSR